MVICPIDNKSITSGYIEVLDVKYKLPPDFLNLCRADHLKELNFDVFNSKRWNRTNGVISKGNKYMFADIRYPGIAIEVEYENKLYYTLVDGLHRMKRQVDAGYKKGIYFCLPFNLIENYIVESDPVADCVQKEYKRGAYGKPLGKAGTP
tara:strand:- start:296 stop:745 length:450 start_codon:yes stop_codon:yes gene_type:complete